MGQIVKVEMTCCKAIVNAEVHVPIKLRKRDHITMGKCSKCGRNNATGKVI